MLARRCFQTSPPDPLSQREGGNPPFPRREGGEGVRYSATPSKAQRGYSLVEFMVGMAVSGVLLGSLVSIVYRSGQAVDSNNSKLVVFREVEKAAAFVGGDVNMAKYTDLVDGAAPVGSLTMEWTEYYAGVNVGHKSIYSLSGGDLARNYDGVANTVAKGVSTVAFSRSGSLVTATFTVATTEGSEQFSQSQTYRFYLRPQT